MLCRSFNGSWLVLLCKETICCCICVTCYFCNMLLISEFPYLSTDSTVSTSDVVTVYFSGWGEQPDSSAVLSTEIWCPVISHVNRTLSERDLWSVHFTLSFSCNCCPHTPMCTTHITHNQGCVHKHACDSCNSNRSTCLFAVSQRLLSLHPHVLWPPLSRIIGCLSNDTKRGDRTHSLTHMHTHTQTRGSEIAGALVYL